MQLTYSNRVINALDYTIDKKVLDATAGSKKVKSEIRRVFQIANRRIQNIEQGDYFSPAVASLGKGDIDRFSKFGMRGKDFKTLKKEYAKAVSFLQQPTSTATGARQFAEQVKSQLNVPDGVWDEARETLINNYDAVTTDLIETLPYKKLVQEMYAETTDDVSDMIERDAKDLADELTRKVEEVAKGDRKSAIDDLFDAFSIDI